MANCEICDKKVSGNQLDSYCDECIEDFELYTEQTGNKLK